LDGGLAPDFCDFVQKSYKPEIKGHEKQCKVRNLKLQN